MRPLAPEGRGTGDRDAQCREPGTSRLRSRMARPRAPPAFLSVFFEDVESGVSIGGGLGGGWGGRIGRHPRVGGEPGFCPGGNFRHERSPLDGTEDRCRSDDRDGEPIYLAGQPLASARDEWGAAVGQVGKPAVLFIRESLGRDRALRRRNRADCPEKISRRE